ncbi:MAG: tRNA (adenosine(37)-N6)-threonylcarbamoyltransferase complex transferase subunit TsaD, partial [Candidatus Wildermuthbacteria bacterium]|nr:tRNA (adenosine(37)-N6)-threonylcarbamoyltransferase complex transferase subunit TsaD [Candidatus Wildermuthbacteria bacterium]
MRILGIETSCDETGIALLDISEGKNPSVRVLSNAIASQVETHRQYGGVYPMIAKREHQQNLPLVLQEAMAGHSWETVEAIALVVGPGLSPCLWAGITFAQDLAKKTGIPVIPSNHLEGHILTALLGETSQSAQYILQTYRAPAVALVVSGGHTQLILAKKIGTYSIIGETRDDAAGECFDKTARMLGLSYPGGPVIAAEAAKGGDAKFKIKLPRPMIHSKNLDFSFSGLKTAALYDWQARPEKIRASKEYVAEMAQEIQEAICDVLVAKTLAATRLHGAKSVILGGGVAANSELRARCREAFEQDALALFLPRAELCTDNGIMAALAGWGRRARMIQP